MRTHRGRAFGGIRRVLSGRSGRTYSRLRFEHRRHRGRRCSWRQDRSAQGQRRCCSREPGRYVTRKSPGRSQYRQRYRLGRRPRRVAARSRSQRRRRLPLRGDGRRRPAVHPVYVGLDRQAQGRAAHDGRLPRLCRTDARICLRLPARRHLLVYRRRRLGDGPQLYRLRASCQRRHYADVRGRAELPDLVAFLGGLR